MNVARVRWRAGLAALALALTLLSAGVRPAPAQDVPPERVRAALAQLDGLAEGALRTSGVPGLAVAVVYRDEVVYLKGFGVREAGRDAAVDADTVFQLASLSKPIAATVVSALVGDGVVTWDDHVVQHLPEFAMYEPWITQAVTLRDMFAHRSGLPDHAGDLLEDMGYDRAAVLHRLRYQRPGSSFRSKYYYTNFGLTAAAEAAARAAGQSWEDLSAARLYGPAGMTSTSSRFADFLAAPNRAPTHAQIDGRFVARYVRDPDPQSPAGGVSSTVRDVARWMRLVLADGRLDGQQLIAAAPLAETHRPQMVSSPPRDPATDRAGFYGLGWNVSYSDAGRPRWSHSGAFAMGAATTAYLVPSEQLGIVALTNAAPVGVPEALAESFLDLALTGQISRDWFTLARQRFAALEVPPYDSTPYATPPANRQPPEPLDAYVGTYENDFFGPIEVARAADGLVLRQGPNGMTAAPLQHFDRDVFVYQPVGENAYGLSGVTFQLGPDRRATSVLVQNLDIHGQGTLIRAQTAR